MIRQFCQLTACCDYCRQLLALSGVTCLGWVDTARDIISVTLTSMVRECKLVIIVVCASIQHCHYIFFTNILLMCYYTASTRSWLLDDADDGDDDVRWYLSLPHDEGGLRFRPRLGTLSMTPVRKTAIGVFFEYLGFLPLASYSEIPSRWKHFPGKATTCSEVICKVYQISISTQTLLFIRFSFLFLKICKSYLHTKKIYKFSFPF